MRFKHRKYNPERENTEFEKDCSDFYIERQCYKLTGELTQLDLKVVVGDREHCFEMSLEDVKRLMEKLQKDLDKYKK